MLTIDLKIKHPVEKNLFFFHFLLNVVLVSFPNFLEDSLSAFDLCEDQAYAL